MVRYSNGSQKPNKKAGSVFKWYNGLFGLKSLGFEMWSMLVKVSKTCQACGGVVVEVVVSSTTRTGVTISTNSSFVVVSSSPTRCFRLFSIALF